ncbi:hypothetical protein [Clostridium sp.]|uniref:hypothetical protein n=1 Tax=Clostridium sp. TaxID=1506 RepID=UPI003F3C91A2
MRVEEYDEYLVFFNEESLDKEIDFILESRVYKVVNLNKNIKYLNQIHRVSFYSDSNIESYSKDVDRYIYIVNNKIILRLELECSNNIISELININKCDLLFLTEVIRDIKIYINSIAIEVNEYEIKNISIIYTLFY